MSMMISVQKPINVSKALEKARSEAAKKGLSFYGDEQSGHGEGFGFKVSYFVQANAIEITVHKKPFILSESKITKEVEKYWSKYMSEEKRAT